MAGLRQRIRDHLQSPATGAADRLLQDALNEIERLRFSEDELETLRWCLRMARFACSSCDEHIFLLEQMLTRQSLGDREPL